MMNRPTADVKSNVANAATPGKLTVMKPSGNELRPNGGTVTVNLPSPGPATLLAPAVTDSALVPVVAPGGHQLTLVNTATGHVTDVRYGVFAG